jgi:hypothetical protein
MHVRTAAAAAAAAEAAAAAAASNTVGGNAPCHYSSLPSLAPPPSLTTPSPPLPLFGSLLRSLPFPSLRIKLPAFLLAMQPVGLPPSRPACLAA